MSKKFQKIGADKILLNSLLIENPKKVKDIINIFGNQFVIVGIDVKK